MSGKRLEWIDVLKGLLILSVVLGHAIQECLKVHGVPFENNFYRNLIYSFHMPAFMAVSGYLSYRGNKSAVTWYNVWQRTIDKFKRLVIPFVFWSVPLFFIYANVGNVLEYVRYPNLGLWFLWVLFFIVVLQLIVNKISALLNVNENLLICLVGIILVIGQFFMVDPKLFGYEYVAFYYIYYFVGYFINKYASYLPVGCFYVLLTGSVWGMGACYWRPNSLPFFLNSVDFLPEFVLKMGYRMAVPLIFCFFMFAAAPYIKISEHMRSVLTRLGKISLGIYASHMVVKKLFAEALCNSYILGGVCGQVVVLFVCLTCFSCFIVHVLNKSKLTSKLFLGDYR